MESAWKTFLSQPDEGTFAAVYQAGCPLVATICRRLLANPDDAADAAQETWTRLLVEAGGGKVSHDGDPHEYLARLAVREADALRKRLGRRAAREVMVKEYPADLAEAPEAACRAASGELREILAELVAELPEGERVAVLLHYFDGLTHRQIADTMGVPRGTVASQLHRAAERLQPRCRRRGIESAAGALTIIAAGASLSAHAAPAAAEVYGVAMASGRLARPAAATGAAGLLAWLAMPKLAALAAVALLVAAVVLLGTAGNRTAPQAPPPLAKVPAATPRPAPPAVVATTKPTPVAAREVALTLRWADDGTSVTGAATQFTAADGKPLTPETPLVGEQPFRLTVANGSRFLLVRHRDAVDGRGMFVVPSAGGRIDATLTATMLIFGEVVDGETGSPVEGATVRLSSCPDTVETTTAPDGHFRQQVPRAAVWTLYAMKDGSTSLDVGPVQGNAIVRPGTRSGPHLLELRPGSSLAVIVSDRESLAALPSAKVIAHNPVGGPETLAAIPDGVASFAALPAGEHRLEVECPGYAKVERTAVISAGQSAIVEVALDRLRPVTGRVVGEDGEPVADVRVVIYCGSCEDHNNGYESRTGEDGKYTVKAGPDAAAKGYIAFSKDGYLQQHLDDYLRSRKADPFNGNDVVLRRVEKRIRGRVLDASGNPLAGAAIHDIGDRTREPLARCDVEGRFEWTPHDAEGDLYASAPGYAMGVFRYSVDKEDDAVFKLGPARQVEGRVVDTNGNPIPSARVRGLMRFKMGRWADIDHFVSLGNLGEVRCDGEGRFRLAELSDEVALSVTAAGFRSEDEFIVPLGERSVEVVLKSEGGLAARVVDADTGEPVTNFRVSVERCERILPNGTTRQSSRGAELDISDAEGRFRIDEEEAGTWVILTIAAAGYPDGRFAAPIGGDVVLKLRRDVRPIAGVATDSDGKPVAGEMVILITWKEAGSLSVFTPGANPAEFALNSVARAFVTTDAEGRFAFPTVIDSAAYSVMLARRKGPAVVMNGIQDLSAEARRNLKLVAGE